MALTNKLTAIGDAIREKTGRTELLKLDEMPSAIASIEGGSSKYAPKAISFYNYQGTELDYELSNLDLSNATSLYNMFSNCKNLTTINLSNFNTENVTTVDNMFYYCQALLNVSLENLKFPNLTTVSSMFGQCKVLTEVDLSSWETSQITSMNQMCQNCAKLTKADLSGLRGTITSFTTVFGGCYKLMHIDIRNLDLSNASTANAFIGVPTSCLIIVKDDANKAWFASNYSTLTNVKTLAEYQAEGGV